MAQNLSIICYKNLLKYPVTLFFFFCYAQVEEVDYKKDTHVPRYKGNKEVRLKHVFSSTQSLKKQKV